MAELGLPREPRPQDPGTAPAPMFAISLHPSLDSARSGSPRPRHPVQAWRHIPSFLQGNSGSPCLPGWTLDRGGHRVLEQHQHLPFSPDVDAHIMKLMRGKPWRLRPSLPHVCVKHKATASHCIHLYFCVLTKEGGLSMMWLS